LVILLRQLPGGSNFINYLEQRDKEGIIMHACDVKAVFNPDVSNLFTTGRTKSLLAAMRNLKLVVFIINWFKFYSVLTGKMLSS